MKLQSDAWPRGFTLVEMMVVVVIAAILLAVAVPAYMNQVRQSRRTDARTAILDLAGREERYFSTNAAAYTSSSSNLGYGAAGWPITVGSGYYQVTVCSPACAPSAVAAPSYTVIATPVGTQVNDTACQGFAVDSTGAQYADTPGGWLLSSTANPTAAYCWSN